MSIMLAKNKKKEGISKRGADKKENEDKTGKERQDVPQCPQERGTI